MHTTVVIPCYNEESRLHPSQFLDFARSVDETIRLLLVDDGSQDGTYALLQDIVAETSGRWQAMRLPRNAGKAEAVRAGVLEALKDSPQAVGYWDADLATPLGLIPDFVAMLEKDPDLDLILGSRVQLLGRLIERNTFRHYLGRVVATLISLALGIPSYDTQCGAKIIRVTEATRGVFERPFRTRWLFDVELIGRYLATRSHDKPLGLFEYPLPEWRDVAGSKVRVKDGLLSLLELLKLYRRELRHLVR